MIIKNFINGQITTGTEPIDPISGVSRGLYINSVLSGNSTSDTLVGLDINPSYSGIAGNYFGLRVSGDTIFATSGGTLVMRTDNNGRVGMGTSSPSTELHIRQVDSNASILRIESASSVGSNTYEAGVDFYSRITGAGGTDSYPVGKMYATGGGEFRSGKLRFQTIITNGGSLTDTMTLYQGNVGIGSLNTLPSKLLQVTGLKDTVVADFSSDTVGLNEGVSIQLSAVAGSYPLGVIKGIFTDYGGYSALSFLTSTLNTPTEAMRITSGQNLLIGTTTDAGQRLQVNGSTRFVGGGSTSGTTGFTVVNSSNEVALQVLNNKWIGMQVLSPSAPLHVYYPGTTPQTKTIAIFDGYQSPAQPEMQIQVGTVTNNFASFFGHKTDMGGFVKTIASSTFAITWDNTSNLGFGGSPVANNTVTIYPRNFSNTSEINTTGAILRVATGSIQIVPQTATPDTSMVGLGIITLNSNVIAKTYTNAINLYIDGPPVAGNNTTITNRWSMYVNSGNTYFGGRVMVGLTGDTGFQFTSSGSTLLRGSGTTSASYALAIQNSSGGTTMVVNNAGNMLIGTTTDAGFKLDVNGTGRFSNALTVGGSNANNVSSLNVLSTYGFLNLTSSVQNNQSTVWLKLQPTHVVGFSVGSIHIGGGNNSISSTSGNAQRNVLMTLSFVNELTSIGLTAIGWQAGYNVTSSSYSVMIGHRAGESVTSGSNNVFIGDNAGNGIVGGTNNLHFAAGEQLTNGDFSNSIHFGSGRANTRSLTFGVGTTTGTYLNNVYFGAGFSTTNTLGGSGRGVTLQPTTESGKTDSSALNITLAGGIGTGAGTPGDVIISTATSGSTGSTLQTLTTRLVVKANTGNVGMGTTSPGDLIPSGWGSGGRVLEILGSSNESTGLFLRRGNFTGIGLDLWSANGAGSSYIDNRYDSSGTSGITIRVRTAGTPRTVAIFDDEFGAKLGDWTNNRTNAVRIDGDLSFRSGGGQRTITGPANTSLILNAIPSSTSEGIILQYNGTTGLVFNNLGNVFIGSSTTDLGFKLSVSGSTLLRGSGTTSASYALATQNSSGGTTMVVNNAGNMLIGTTTDAGFKLNVNGTGRVTTLSVGDGISNQGTIYAGQIDLNYPNLIRYQSAYYFTIQPKDNSGNSVGTGGYVAIKADTIQLLHDAYFSIAIATTTNSSDTVKLKRGITAGHIPMYIAIEGADAAGYNYGTRSGSILIYPGEQSFDNGYGSVVLAHNGINERGSVLIGTSTTNNSRLLVGGTVSGATLSTTRAVHINPTLLATGNTTTLIGLDIQPRYSIGSYTGLTQIALRVSGGTQIIGSGSTGTTLSLFSVDGASGRLFDVTDDFTNSLFSVNTSSGVPVIEAFANNSIVMGTYGSNVLVVSGTSVSVGTNQNLARLFVKSSGTSTSNAFVVQNSSGGTISHMYDNGSATFGTSSNGGFKYRFVDENNLGFQITNGDAGGSTGRGTLIIGESSANGRLVITTNTSIDTANIGYTYGGVISFSTGGTERMRLARNASNLLINTTTDSGHNLNVNGTSNFSGNMTLGGTATLGSTVIGNSGIAIGDGSNRGTWTVGVGYVVDMSNVAQSLGVGSVVPWMNNSISLGAGAYADSTSSQMIMVPMAMSATTMSSGSTAELYISNNSQSRLSIPNLSVINAMVTVDYIATCTLTGSSSSLVFNDVKAGTQKFYVKRWFINNVGAYFTISTPVDVYSQSDSAMSGATLSYEYVSASTFKVKFNAPPTANGSTFKCAATVRVTTYKD